MSIKHPTYTELQSWLLVERKYADRLRLERDAAQGEALAASVVGEKLAQQVDNMAVEARAASQRRSDAIARIEVLRRRLRDLTTAIEIERKHRCDADSKLREIRGVLAEVDDLPSRYIFRAYVQLRNAIA